MAKPRVRSLDYLVYVAVRVIICVVQALPVGLAWAFARLLGRLSYLFNRRHRLVAEENIRQAFPELSQQQIDRLVRKMYAHFALMVIEMMLMPRKYHRSNIMQIVAPVARSDYERSVQLVRSGRPLMVITGHFGSWETICYAFGLAGFHAKILARRLDNPYLDRFVHRFRISTGQSILDKNQDLNEALRTLTEKGILGMVGDQDAGQRGMFVNFFGRPASTFKSIGVLSLQYSAPILVVGAWRTGAPLNYSWRLADVIDPKEFDEQPNAVRRITERYTQALENMVREHPEQYFWLHRRWKHQPRDKQVKNAA